MTTRCLLDASVLVYSVDASEAVKQERAVDVLDRLARTDLACTSTQTLGEAFHAMTRRIVAPVPTDTATELLRAWQATWPVLGTDSDTLSETLRGHLRYGLPWWDAQLWATARLSRVPIVLSEDFSDGTCVEDVSFVDPFAEGFDIDEVLRIG